MDKLEIDLPERIIITVAKIAEKFPEIERIDVFGSRVLGNAKKGSDIDLAVYGGTLTPQVVSAFQDCLEEKTNIPYLFDIIQFEVIQNTALRDHITQFGRPLYSRQTRGEDF